MHTQRVYKHSLLSCLLAFHFHVLEKEMATHSSVLAWRNPGTGEPGGLPSMGLQSRTRLQGLSRRSSSRQGLGPPLGRYAIPT